MRVAVYGAGGVGGYFGGRLALSGAEVHLIARGAHLEALLARGLKVRSGDGDFEVEVPATDDPAKIGECDYVLFTVKSFDTAEAAARLPPLIGAHGAVISLQNGLDNEEEIAAKVGWTHVMGGVTYIFANIAEPGVIKHTGGRANMIIGEMDGTVSARARRFFEQCRRAEIDVTLTEDIRSVLWRKLSIICAFAGMTATTGLPIGASRTVAESREMFRRLIDEVGTVAAAEGVALPDDLADQHLAWIDSVEAEGRSSMYHDLSRGHRIELEALHGAIVRRARKRGVDVPMSQAVYALLKPWAIRNEQGSVSQVDALTSGLAGGR